ncbi:MAG: decaprenyl-phosphate phosphoribosyltransferase [Prevotella sp.]|nr:decaprenyl-phosphate phosphoribosyltransferase [Prevotella sp.]
MIKLIRPHQWIKNVFIFMPMFFGGKLTDTYDWLQAIIAFASFSFVASAVYCLNDIMDVEDDRRHPVKCNRPIASGKITIPQAMGIMVVLLTGATALLTLLTQNREAVAAVILGYFIMNTCYCTWLKHHAIVDVCIVAFGFVLRLIVGGLVTDTPLSKWIVLMTFLLTLFLSFAKRRDDVVRMEQTGEAPRKNTIRYNLTFINQAITITSAVTLVCYIMYTVSPEVTSRANSEYLYLTTVFVLLGLLRYIQLTVVDKRSGDPTKILLHDRFVQVDVLLWALSFILIIYYR